MIKKLATPTRLVAALLLAAAPASQLAAQTPDATAAPAPTPVLTFLANQATNKVSPDFFGLMTEEINYSYEGGIYAELIRNRAFKADAIVPTIAPDVYNPSNYYPHRLPQGKTPRFWGGIGGATVTLDTNTPLNQFLNVGAKINTTGMSNGVAAGITNNGYWGIPVQPKSTYLVSFWAKADTNFRGPITVSIQSDDGQTVYASAKITGIKGEWKKFETKLKTKDGITPSKSNNFSLTTTAAGTFWVQNVSLFPPTYKNRANGNRADIMELLADMKPKFLRLPGGNYVEGNAFNQRFNWKETIGPVEQRPGHPSCWGYWSTDGMGILEFAEWCEDLDMEPVLGVFAGYALNNGGHLEAGPKLQPYVQEALDEIEYLTGSTKTTWGARRAKDGHPKPFRLKYVEIGNEDWFDRSGSYEGRFTQFFDAIKAKYPNLKIISSMGHEQSQNVWVKSRLPDLVDEHFYRNQQDMEVNFHQYDNRSRAADQSKVFVGEWATRVGSPTPNMAGALGDAAWMCGMERNSDVVLMECFAPLFVNVSALTGQNRSMQWESDLIGYDALNSYGSPSYYVETMFAQNVGDTIVPIEATNIPTISQTPPAPAGRGGRGGQPAARRVSGLYYSATRDSAKGTLYIKVVNAAEVDQPVTINIQGVNAVDNNGQTITLQAEKIDDTNSIDNRGKLAPFPVNVGDLSPKFTKTLPKLSLTVFKIKTK